jgi:hypothetical protein
VHAFQDAASPAGDAGSILTVLGKWNGICTLARRLIECVPLADGDELAAGRIG